MSKRQIENEKWQPVVGYEGFYEVSDLGRARGVARTVIRRNGKPYPVPARLLRGITMERGGYLAYMLCKRGCKRLIPAHVMVLAAFLGPRPPQKESLHQDGNPLNCLLTNLRYGTKLENAADAILHGRTRRGTKHHQARLTDKKIAFIREAYASGGSQTELARLFLVSLSTINAIIHRRTWAHLP